MTDTLNAAETVSTDECWPGGSLGLNVTGAGVTLGVWDGGGVRTTHNEFTVRATQRDGNSAYNFHSTHVAGTMIAAGVWTGSSPERTRGMSFEAELDAYDWDSDEAEMSNAAMNGLLVSNHSYGFGTGWEYGPYGMGTGWYWFGDVTISAFEDYLFGFYSLQSMTWDQISHQHPTYLIVTSAGNDRNDAPAPGSTHYYISNGNWKLSSAVRSGDCNGGFDCLSHASVAKNVLSVGAVHDIFGGYSNPSNVTPASFTSYGPTDDGRIKPDIVANGVQLTSSSSGSNND